MVCGWFLWVCAHLDYKTWNWSKEENTINSVLPLLLCYLCIFVSFVSSLLSIVCLCIVLWHSFIYNVKFYNQPSMKTSKISSDIQVLRDIITWKHLSWRFIRKFLYKMRENPRVYYWQYMKEIKVNLDNILNKISLDKQWKGK
jgi:hypothetical protein